MRLQIVVPMAGEGRRFSVAGYTVPKPLVPVAGLPMVVRAVRDLPTADRIVFVVRSEHIRTYRVEASLMRLVPAARIVVVEAPTEGQACTVRAAGDALEPDWPVIVAACDNTHLYDRPRLLALMDDPKIECLVWTYRGDARVLAAPTDHGWVRTDGDRVLEVSCKKPISDRPLTDHAVSGFFSFQNAGRMLAAIDAMIERGIQVNDEFYLDTLPNLLIEQSLDVRVFEVEKYIGWGTPRDLADFQHWERYFAGIR